MRAEKDQTKRGVDRTIEAEEEDGDGDGDETKTR